jgi:alkylation response protein AidB-like acyl-CoA dehydrogenase
MQLPPSLHQLDARLRDVILGVSPVSRFQQLDDARTFDAALHAALAEQGVWGLGIPRELGGGGGGTAEQLIALRALGHHATSMGMFGVVNFLCTRILAANASEAQREELLRPLAQGRMQASFCLTEKQGGTDILRLMETRASRDGSAWVLDGVKTWICGADQSDFLIVVARTAPGKTDGVTMFLVPRTARGVSVERLRTFAVNGYSACEVRFDGVRVPDKNVLGQAGQGFRQLVAMLNAERLSASANALGMAQGALQLAADHARERKAFEKTLAHFQAVQHKLANAALTYELAWTYLMAAAESGDRGEAIDVASSMAKLASVKAAQEAADIGMEILGAAAFDVGNPMQRYYRDHRLYVIAPLNNDMSRSLVAERYFDLPRAF